MLATLCRHASLATTLAVAIVSICLGGSAAAQPSPTAHFFGSQTSVPNGGLSYPYRVATDSAGNVYISNTQANTILKETLANGVYTESVVASSGLVTPYGIAVDSSGNVYVADNGHNRIVKETPGPGGYTQSVISTTTALSYPTGVAVDASGKLYIADTGVGKILVETPSGASTYTETALTYASNFAQIVGITVDPQGDIFVSDIDNWAVYEETYSAGTYTPSTIPTSGLNYPYDISVDPSGNLYIADFTNKRIVLETYVSPGNYTQSVLPTENLAGPLGVAFGGDGKLYIADTFGFDIKQVTWGGANAGPVNLASNSATVSMLFQFSGGTPPATLALSATQVLTQGAAGQDFADAHSGSCSTSASYSDGDFCSVGVTFTPQYPGQRSGAVQLLGAGSAPIATGYIPGIGIGPQLNYYYPEFSFSTVQVVAGPGSPYNLSSPFGAAVDSLGNIYIADSVNNAVYQETLSSGSYTQTTIASGLNSPQAVAVDGAGNVYIVDSGNNQILMETNVAGTWVQSTVVTGLNFPSGIALDGQGSVYYSSFNDGVVYKLTQSNGVFSAPAIVASGLNQPRKLTLDAAGNIYIADTGNSRVVKETYTGTGYTQSTIGTSLLYPYAIAVAADGTVFVADTDNHRVLAETPSGGSYTQSIQIPGPTATDLLVDQAGNIVLTNVPTAAVYTINYNLAPGLSFQNTLVGQTSSDSPQTAGIINVGNAALNLTAPATGDNPSISTGFVLDSSSPEDCPSVAAGASPATLNPGESCLLPVSFQPTSIGTDNGSISIQTNSLNTAATASIILSGTGLGLTFTAPASTTLAAGTVAVAFPAVTFVATGGTAPYTYSIIGGSLPAGLALSTTGTLSGTPTAGGTFSFTVQATDSASVTGTETYLVTINAPSITVSPSSLPTGIYGVTYSQSFTAAGGTGPYTYSAIGTLPPGLTLSTAGVLSGAPSAVGGPYSFSVTATDSSTGTGPFLGTQAVALSIAKATPTITTPPSTSAITYGQPLSASNLNGGVASVDGTFAWTSPATTPSAGTQTASVTFTPTDTADYNTATATVSVVVGKATPTITTPPSTSAITYGQPLSASNLNGGVASVDGTFAWTSPATTPGAGTQSASVTFTPTDTADYTTATATVSVVVGKATPTITTPPAASAITYGQPLSASNLTGGIGSVDGTFAWTNASVTLPVGTQSESVLFTPTNSADYGTASANVSVTVNKATIPVTITPASASSLLNQPLSVTVTLAGTATPTGTVTLSSGTYTSAATALVSGAATIVIPADSLAAGSDTLTATYSGDGNYTANTGTASEAVTVPVVVTTSLTTLNLTPGQDGTSTFTITPLGGFIGNVTLSAVVTSSIPGVKDIPTVTFSPSNVVTITGAAAQTASLVVTTTAPSLSAGNTHSGGKPWYATGGTALAGILLLILPGRRRRWQKMLATLLLSVTVLGALTACSGTFTPQNSGPSTPGTLPGTYTITLTAAATNYTQTTTITVNVE